MTEVNEVNIRTGGKMADGGGGGLGKLIKLILFAVLLGLLGIGGYLAYTFLTGGSGDAAMESAGTADIRSGGGSIENPYYMELGEFIVNLADGRRYLKTKLILLMSEEKAKEYLTLRIAEVKDLVNAELQTLTSEQLRDGRNRTLLKKRLINKIRSLLPNDKDREWDDPDPIKKVLVTEFYLQ